MKRRIYGEKASELCIELCQRIDDVYTGPYYVSIKSDKVVLNFWGQKGSYTAIPTPEGLLIKDEKGTVVNCFSDITDIAF